jgi:hypothetical protein
MRVHREIGEIGEFRQECFHREIKEIREELISQGDQESRAWDWREVPMQGGSRSCGRSPRECAARAAASRLPELPDLPEILPHLNDDHPQ